MIDFDEIRKTVAIRHGVLLESNDPVLVTVTLNELVLSRYVEILTEQNEAHRKAIEAALRKVSQMQSRRQAGLSQRRPIM